MEKCSHSKVYADYVLMSNPSKIPWICSKCGEKGFDVYGAIQKKLNYEQVSQLFEKK